MSLITRRQTQYMLDDLDDYLSDRQRQTFVSELGHKKIDTSFPKLAELIVLWCVVKSGHDLEVEPDWWQTNTNPDGFSKTILPGEDVIFDVTSLSDASVSKRDDMEIVSSRICQFASNEKRKLGSHLLFEFFESRNIEGHRHVMIYEDYKLSEVQMQRVKDWISSDAYISEPITVQDENVAFQIKYSSKKVKGSNFHTSMPPTCYSLEDNALYRTLKCKKRQLKNEQYQGRRVIFVVDVGSTLIEETNKPRFDHSSSDNVTAAKIIKHFLSKSGNNIDAVVLLSAVSTESSTVLAFLREDQRYRWENAIFSSSNAITVNLKKSRLFERLPIPVSDAKGARQNHRRGAFKAKSNLHFNSNMTSWKRDGNICKLKISAGRLSEVLQGNSSELDYLQMDERTKKLVDRKSIVNVEFEKSDNHDDDYIVLTFGDDPAVRSFN